MHAPTVVNNSNYTHNTTAVVTVIFQCVWRWMMTIGIQDSLKSLGKIKIHSEEVAIIDRDSDDEDDTADQEELSKLKNYKEAVVALE